MLAEINNKVGFRLLAKEGEQAAVVLARLVPVAGGVIGGAVDLVACQAVGSLAKAAFRPGDDPQGGEETAFE